MTKLKHKKLVLPALRGVMGTWVYYSCLMQLDEIGKRVSYANEIHPNELLSDMIQRVLKKGRSKQIAEYLAEQKERFFNSLVIATYGGEPNWHSLGSVNSTSGSFDPTSIDSETMESVGFLTLRGDENLFAIDGQHRLSGIKQAMNDKLEDVLDDTVSVIFVAHKDTTQGLMRTRRLFTTLNKTAKPVSKGDIIALDEDDAMAIIVRRLIEKTKLFEGERVAFVANNNMPTSNSKSLTTIGVLYDVLKTLFSKLESDVKKSVPDLLRVRPSDEKLDAYQKLAVTYFSALASSFPNLKEFFDSQEPQKVVSKYRGSFGGDILYRPIGLVIFTDIVIKLSKEMELKKAIKLAAKLPTDITKEPYREILWHSSTGTIHTNHNVTLRETLLNMVGHSQYKEATLLKRYRAAMDDLNAKLPELSD
ncbi:MAG: DNA sulfur modification protein DndB [Paracoccaceae bacterium]